MAAEADTPLNAVTDFFEADDPLADVSLIVEGYSIHFNRALLMMSSPVFARMFTSDFKERDQQTVSLPEKGIVHFLAFLAQLHPAHSWLPLKDEELEPILRLADEYNVAHVKRKCSQFIRSRMENWLSTDQVMRYFWLSESFQLVELQPDLLGLVSEHNTEAVEGCQYYQKLQASTQMGLLKKRCRTLEDVQEQSKKMLMEAGQIIRKIKPIVDKLPGIVQSLPEECQFYCVHCHNPVGCRGYHSGPWKGGMHLQIGWCTQCVKHASDLQKSFCQGCVLQKLVVLMQRVDELVQPLMKAMCVKLVNIRSITASLKVGC